MKTTCADLLLVSIVLGGAALAAGPPPTRLYVRTVPPGARVVVDGKPLGVADDLFIILPGNHTVTVELEGFEPVQRDVQAAPERITRVVLTLVKQGGAADPPAAAGDGAAADAAAALIASVELPEALGAAMQKVVRQHPGETRWSGRHEGVLFAVAVKRLPDGPLRQRATPALLELAHSLAAQELLKAKSLLDRYAAAGLDDLTILRQAVVQAAGALQVTGEVGGLSHQAAVRGDYAAACVRAEEAALTAHLLQPAEFAKVQAAYREVMHAQARDLMARKQWRDALELWTHLHARRLVSQALYLDAVTCFVELQQADQAVPLLREAYAAFGAAASAEWLEQCGDLAVRLGKPGEALAVQAYKQASERLKNAVSGLEKPQL